MLTLLLGAAATSAPLPGAEPLPPELAQRVEAVAGELAPRPAYANRLLHRHAAAHFPWGLDLPDDRGREVSQNTIAFLHQ
jgi:hypothetical protein